MTIDLSQFHQVFFEESFEGLGVMESGLLRMDPGAVDGEEINVLFRAAHSIKGGSATFGFNDIAAFTHVMESLLDEVREQRRQLTSRSLAVLLSSIDVLRAMLTAASGDGALDNALVARQQQELEAVLNNRESSPVIEHCAAPQANSAIDQVIGWHLVFRPLPNMMRTGNDPLRIIRELAGLGELDVKVDISLLPGFEQFDPEECHLCWDLHLHAAVEQARINEIFEWVEEQCDLVIVPLPGKDPASSTSNDQDVERDAETPRVSLVPAADSEAERHAGNERRRTDRRENERTASGAGSIRVDIQKIDNLINVVGELVITQSMLSMLGENFQMGQLERLKEGLSEMERHTHELQESVMQIRMLPISSIFSRFPRIVHDLSNQMEKKIELRLTGENTEVDKTVIEKIGDPLVHLVRNSLDHGIEAPAERIAAGKPETGTIELKACHQGGNIVIEIRDDGSGLDPERILRKAIEKGLVDSETQLSEQQSYELIFQAGFSTVETISDLSGRGVGLDVVRRNINELGGTVEIESKPGRGSAIIIRLPLTLAILDGQSVSVGDEIYIIPLLSIIESIQVKPDMVNLIAGRAETCKLRGEYLPVIRLYEILGVQGYRTGELTDGLLVVVEGEGRRCGILVDELIGQQQVVIKPLEVNYQRVDGISAATILGDGSVALILDVPGIMRLANATPELRVLQCSA